jgi:uncharacterized protein
VTETTLIKPENYRARTRYRVDLAAYMRTCDTNYIRLLKLIPILESGRTRYFGAAPAALPSWEFLIGSEGNGRPPIRIRLQLLEAFPYTSTLKIVAHGGFPAWSTAPVILLRMYHDAATAEPLSYQGHRQIPVRCEVPNTTMYHHDEKRQINEFLADWLRLCLRSGINTKTSQFLCID